MHTISIPGAHTLNIPLRRTAMNGEDFSIYVVHLRPADERLPSDPEGEDAWASVVDNWVVILFNATSVHTFGIQGGIKPEDGPYTHVHTVNKVIKSSRILDEDKVKDYIPGGYLPQDLLGQFQSIFHETEAGPNQYFVCRFFVKLFEAGLGDSDEDLIKELTGKAEYSDTEFHRYDRDGKYYPIDCKHLKKWDGKILCGNAACF